MEANQFGLVFMFFYKLINNKPNKLKETLINLEFLATQGCVANFKSNK